MSNYNIIEIFMNIKASSSVTDSQELTTILNAPAAVPKFLTTLYDLLEVTQPSVTS